MRVLLPLLAVAGAVVATSCARSLIYSCGGRAAAADVARVDVRARADANYDLEIVHVDGPGHGNAVCSAPAYAIGEEATLIEMGGGEYTLLAKAEDSTVPYAFPLRGVVAVQRGRCYVPAMSCDAGTRPDGLTCRLVLKPTDCAFHFIPRRVVIEGMSAC
jgi:hypothetical protein